MRLIFFIDSGRNIGGGDYAQFVFAHELSKRGHEVTIFSGDRNFYSPQLDKSNLKVFYRHTIPIFIKKIGLGQLNKLWNKIYTKFIIESYVKHHKPDVLVGYLRESAIKAQKIGNRYKIKVANFVFENPQWMEEDLGDIWREEWSQKSFQKSWLATKSAYEKSDVLIPNSKLSGKKMKEWIPNANVSKQVYPGVQVPKRRKLKRDIDVLYIGRLNKLKHVDILLKAVKPKWKTVIMGAKGDQEEYLKNLSKELNLTIEFTGPVSDEKKWELLSRTKVLATASSHEGFGMPPLEALAYGCRVVCSNLPIFKEVYGKDVSYFTLHDHKELRKKISLELNKKESKSSLPNTYTWKNAAVQIENILKKLIKK